jgi:hypothetical protein
MEEPRVCLILRVVPWEVWACSLLCNTIIEYWVATAVHGHLLVYNHIRPYSMSPPLLIHRTYCSLLLRVTSHGCQNGFTANLVCWWVPVVQMACMLLVLVEIDIAGPRRRCALAFEGLRRGWLLVVQEVAIPHTLIYKQLLLRFRIPNLWGSVICQASHFFVYQRGFLG